VLLLGTSSKPLVCCCRRSLHTLDLGGNDIGPEGAKVLADTLGSSPALKLLELGYNPLGPEGEAAWSGSSHAGLGWDICQVAR
jgi:Ran GTPase-activating protein (RanGAP) involved in mRNA processing and transport